MTEQLKAGHQIEGVVMLNNIRYSAEEVVLKEIYISVIFSAEWTAAPYFLIVKSDRKKTKRNCIIEKSISAKFCRSKEMKMHLFQSLQVLKPNVHYLYHQILPVT